jgi:patatin-related protein
MTDTTPRMEVEQEVRFAVVMYGGLSLAIYMNGIAQELLHLVRATAPDPDDPGRPLHPNEGPNGLTPLERVYRQLGQLLGPGGDLERQQGGAAATAWDVDAPPPDPIRTRFVIDILSGTSAGGINAVFLAKALANGQTMDQLKDLWVAEGDVEKLINDDGAAVGGLPVQRPPKSLFSGQRMYVKLVEAFDGMEDPRALSERSTRSPYVEELDLFVTATDLVGLPVPLRLSDAVVMERRHRNVFHFAYGRRPGAVHNDFHARNNGFLAFAARCTSSFPGAFEPMRLDTVTAALRASGKSWHAGITGHDVERWRAYFPEYRNDGDRFVRRAFADGGYLDNKPLGYAVDQLAHRRASIPVSRKLIYVEPSPEHVNPLADVGEPPGAFSATLSAFTLARYETIREDLERVLARNRLIDRVATLTRGFEEDLDNEVAGERLRMTGEAYGRTFLKGMIAASGIGAWYGGYHRLKVATLSDELAALIANLAGFDERSDDLLAIRYLVRAFRESRYKRYEEESDDGLPAPRMSEARFLLNFDLSFRVRRLRFAIHQLDTWLRCTAESDLEERRRGKLEAIRQHARDGARPPLPEPTTGTPCVEPCVTFAPNCSVRWRICRSGTRCCTMKPSTGSLERARARRHPPCASGANSSRASKNWSARVASRSARSTTSSGRGPRRSAAPRRAPSSRAPTRRSWTSPATWRRA